MTHDRPLHGIAQPRDRYIRRNRSDLLLPLALSLRSSRLTYPMDSSTASTWPPAGRQWKGWVGKIEWAYVQSQDEKSAERGSFLEISCRHRTSWAQGQKLRSGPGNPGERAFLREHLRPKGAGVHDLGGFEKTFFRLVVRSLSYRRPRMEGWIRVRSTPFVEADWNLSQTPEERATSGLWTGIGRGKHRPAHDGSNSLPPPPFKNNTYAIKIQRNYFRGNCNNFA